MNGHLDRTGEPIEEAPETGLSEPEHDERCVDGWIDRDAVPAVPCTICKPHLAPDAIRRRIHGVDPVAKRIRDTQ